MQHQTHTQTHTHTHTHTQTHTHTHTHTNTHTHTLFLSFLLVAVFTKAFQVLWFLLYVYIIYFGKFA